MSTYTTADRCALFWRFLTSLKVCKGVSIDFFFGGFFAAKEKTSDRLISLLSVEIELAGVVGLVS